MERRSKKIIYFISFVLMFLIGIVLVLDIIFGEKLGAFGTISKKVVAILAYIIVCINGYLYVKTKRSGIFMAIYFLGILLLLACIILPFII